MVLEIKAYTQPNYISTFLDSLCEGLLELTIFIHHPYTLLPSSMKFISPTGQQFAHFSK